MELEEDWLLSLPKIILHRILSRLPEKDRARTSVLSKAWLDTWYTFPILFFSDIKILGLPQAKPIEDSARKREILEFCDYVKRSMLKFRDQSLTIKEFKLHVLRLELRHISKDIKIWLKLACECGVEVIQYYQNLTRNQDQYDYHALPRCVIEAKSLTKLVLVGFINIDPIFMNYSIKFFSLRVLSLKGMYFWEINMQLTTSSVNSVCLLIFVYTFLGLCRIHWT